jgi:uncharacterized DUF497 family protein
MEFEYDPRKSKLNKSKHGIDFEEAKAIWDDGDSIRLDTLFENEQRYLVVGSVNEKLWTAVVTMRNEVFRIISVRRSRENETKAYNNCRRI